jgi:hypothetical protein
MEMMIHLKSMDFEYTQMLKKGTFLNVKYKAHIDKPTAII